MVKTLRHEAQAAKAEVEQKYKSGVLGPVGRTDELARVGQEFIKRLDEPRRKQERGRKHAAELKRQSRVNPLSVTSKNADEAVERAFQRHRAIQRFENLDSSKRRQAVDVALEKRDWSFLTVLLGEPALLDERTARVIEIEMLRNTNREAFDQLQELEGIFRYDGEVDGLTGALPVLGFCISETENWLKQEFGDGSMTLEKLAQSKGLAQPVIDDGSITLTREAAHDVELFRAAKAEAESRGLSLQVEPFENEASQA